MRVIFLGSLVVSVMLAANEPYIGKWKLNPARSQLTGETFSLEKTSSGGDLRFSTTGVSYTFKLDGKEYPMPTGGTTSWKSVSEDTWEVTNRMGGKVTVTYTLALKGDKMTSIMRRVKPDGGTLEESAVANRISGGPGFLGKWRISEVKTPPTTMELTSDGSNGITVRYPETDFVCSGAFDGRENHPGGRLAGSKMTFAFKKTGTRSFEMTERVDGKPTYVDTFSVSDDGKTLTDEEKAVGSSESTKGVYERQ